PAAAFTLIASPEAWEEFAKPVPAGGYQSIVAMCAGGIAASRATCWSPGGICCFSNRSSRPVGRRASRRLAVRKSMRGAVYRARGRAVSAARSLWAAAPHFFPGAGLGIPLVRLHTAGGDARQYQALLARLRGHRV